MTVMQTYNMFSIKLLFLLHVFYGSTFACHTKGTKNPLKQKVKTCHFVNVSKPLENNHWNRNSKSSTAQQLFFFNASKPNVAILSCFENNIKYLSPSLSEQYTNDNSYFTNSPTECQSICQVTDKCNHFTYNFEKTNVGCLLGSLPLNHPKMGTFQDQNIVKHFIQSQKVDLEFTVTNLG